MQTILITNDDGYKSAGFIPLIKTFSKDFNVVPVAPDRGKSWIGKAITTKKKLQVKTFKRDDVKIFTLNATPADCVQIGVYHLTETRPKLVVSGINIGLNIGNARMLSSGTLGGAIEASLEGVKAIAVSLSIPLSVKDKIDFYSQKSYHIFEPAAQITKKLAHIFLENNFDKNVDLLSINVPFNVTINTPVEITIPFRTPYGQLFHKNKGKYIQKTPPVEFKNMKEGTDLKALDEEKISVTPVSLALVSETSIKTTERIIKQAW